MKNEMLSEEKVVIKHWDTCSRKERIQRWEHVVGVLSRLTPHERRAHWDMSVWGMKTDCGTIACAAGHCGLNRWFRERGLRLVPDVFGVGHFHKNRFSENPVMDFFGTEGTRDIFWNSSHRPVSKVIRECLFYIKRLKAAS